MYFYAYRVRECVLVRTSLDSQGSSAPTSCGAASALSCSGLGSERPDHRGLVAAVAIACLVLYSLGRLIVHHRHSKLVEAHRTEYQMRADRREAIRKTMPYGLRWKSFALLAIQTGRHAHPSPHGKPYRTTLSTDGKARTYALNSNDSSDDDDVLPTQGGDRGTSAGDIEIPERLAALPHWALVRTRYSISIVPFVLGTNSNACDSLSYGKRLFRLYPAAPLARAST